MNNDKRVISRRHWVGLAAAVASGVPIGALAAEHDANAKPPAGGRAYNVRDFGAKGDETTLDTAAVQAAIDACHADQGGTVLVPAGDFLVGTLELKSYVTLHLAAHGKLLGSPNIEHYHAGNGIPRGNGNIVLLSAADADNVTIEGRGMIDGNGAKFFTGRGDNTGPGQNSAEGYFRRPHLMVFHKCRNLLIRDVFLTASAYHCCRILQCSYVRLDGVRIHNRVNKNNDGFHLVSNQYVNIVNCNVACQDDACALFGSNQFVTITNCSFSTRWSVFRFGGGNPQNITISNCLIYETYGCPIKMRFGSGTRAQNIAFSNLVMQDVTGPISIGFDARSRRSSTTGSTAPAATAPTVTVTTTTPTTQSAYRFVRNISFNHIRAFVVAKGRQHADLPFDSAFRDGETRTCITLNGVGDCFLENISFSDVHVTYEGGGTAEEAKREVPRMAGEYFEIGTPPAYGLYARNVRGLTLDNLRLEVEAPDLRPAVVFEQVQDATVAGLNAAGNVDAEATVRFVGARDVLLTAPRLLTPAAAFLQIEGDNNGIIIIDGGDLSKAAKPLAAVRGASENTVKLRV